MTLSIVVAMSQNRVIGAHGKIPWRLPSDLKRFRELTWGHKVIMGRKTYESLPEQFRPLPGRQNIVISRSWTSRINSVMVARSLEEAVSLSSNEEVFVIGGGEIYQQALPLTSRIYVTEVQVTIDGDVSFPSLGGEWLRIHRSATNRGDKDQYASNFAVYLRTQS